MKTHLLIYLLFAAPAVVAQTDTHKPTLTLGVEVDALPYLTGGYYGSIWAGHNHVRYRAIITQVTTPSFMLEDGFANNKIQCYTAVADYFFGRNFQKWWVGSGVEYWRGSIQSEQKLSTARYSNVILTAGGGYVWKFFRNFYINPWVAIHTRVAGDSHVLVDGLRFHPARLTPEFSVKIGWKFPLYLQSTQ